MVLGFHFHCPQFRKALDATDASSISALRLLKNK